MNVDQDPPGHPTPPCTPFDECFTTTASKGAPTKDPPAGIQAESFYTTLYTESQTTGHSDHTTTYTNPARDAQPAAGAAATSFEAKAEAATTTTEVEAAAAAEAEAATAKTYETEKHAAAAHQQKL